MTAFSQFDLEQMQSRLRLNVPDEKRKRVSGDVAAESELHEQIIQECRRRLWPFVHSRMDKKTRTKKGVPDFVICADRGRTIWIEAKGPETKISPEQRIFIAMAKKLGTIVHVCRSMDQVMELFQ